MPNTFQDPNDYLYGMFMAIHISKLFQREELFSPTHISRSDIKYKTLSLH